MLEFTINFEDIMVNITVFKSDSEIELFKNILFLDNLFKLDNSLYSACVDKYIEHPPFDFDFHIIEVNGFEVSVEEEAMLCKFSFVADGFQFVVDNLGVYCYVGNLVIYLSKSSGSSELADVFIFKETILNLINHHKNQNYASFDQFVDIFNLKFRTQ